jgi:WD40 repeat protein
MASDELRAAIVEPARGAGLRLEPGLVELLVSEVDGEPGALPLLAHALRATWEERDGRTLTLDAYRATGGVSGAIGSTADHVLAGFDDTDREIAQQLLLRLVEPGDTLDTRRRATLSELRPAGDQGDRVDGVVGALAAARLVSIDEGTVQLAHEALIREWPELRTWLADQHDDLRVQRQVTVAAEAWTASGREPSELYRGPRLARALEWLDRRPQASEAEVAFLHESAAEEQRVQKAQARANRRLRTSLVGVGVALVLAVVGGALAVARGRQAADSRDHADVARLAAVSRSLVERQPTLGLLLAVEAHAREDSAETRSSVLAAVEAHPLLVGLIHGTDAGLEAAVFTPDGRTLATPTSDGSGTILWDTATRRRLGALQHGDDLVFDASISPDGGTLAAVAGSVGPNGEPVSHLQVWDLRERRLLHYIDSHAGTLTSAAFSADGRTLVTQGGATFDAPPHLTAVVWDTATWQPRGEPWQLTDEYVDDRVIFLSRDGKVLTAPDGDGATVWDVATRTERRHIAVTDEALSALALNSDGSAIALGLASGVVRTVDTTTGDTLTEVMAERDGFPSSIEFSADDAVMAVATGTGRTQLFAARSATALGPPLAANAAAVNDVSFSADGNRLATAGLDRSGAIWRLDGDRPIAVAYPDHESAATQVVVTPDGRYVVSGGTDGVVTRRDVGSTSGQAAQSTRRDGEVMSIDIDATGERVVSGDTAGTVTVATLADLRTQRTRVFDDSWVWAASFNPASGIVAIGVEVGPLEDGFGGFVALWDPVRDREVAPRIAEPGGAPIALAWSPDGQTLAVSSDNNVLRFYRAGSTYVHVGEDLAIEDEPMTSLDIAPDGLTIAAGTASGTVRQYDLASRDSVGPALTGLGFDASGVAYSPDGSMLAATSLGIGTSRLWDAATGAPIGDQFVAGRTPYSVFTSGIYHSYPSQPAFSPDGDTLFTPAADGLVVAWDLRPPSWVDAACRLAGRNLTEAEWRQYVGAQQYHQTCEL